MMNDPGAAEFVEVAEGLRLEGQHQQALIVLLQGLSRSPSNHSGRLLLARVFFELDCAPFALNQLDQLCSIFPNNTSLIKLFHQMGGLQITQRSSSGEGIVAESEIDFDAIEELD